MNNSENDSYYDEEAEQKNREARAEQARRPDARTVSSNKKFGGFFGGKRDSAIDLDAEHKQSKQSNKKILFGVIALVVSGAAIIIYQLYEQYGSSQTIGAGASISERDVQTTQQLVAGQKVNPEYAEKVKLAEAERANIATSGGGSYVEQNVDVLAKDTRGDSCPNCEERIQSLEELGDKTVGSLQLLETATQQLSENQVIMSKELGDIKAQLTNVTTRAINTTTSEAGESAPIPTINYYEDYMGREYMSAPVLNDEFVKVSTLINKFASDAVGANLQYHADFSPIPSSQDKQGGSESDKGEQTKGGLLNQSTMSHLPTGYYDGQLEVGVNTDKGSSPLVATITTGPYRGVKLFSSGHSAQRDGVQIMFTSMQSKDGQFHAVQAFAVEAGSREPGVASSVNNHYVSRILGAVLTTGVQGWGAAYAQQGTTVHGEGATTTTRQTSDKSALRQGIGAGAGAASSIIADITNRPATIKVDAQSYQIGIYVIGTSGM